MNRQVAFLVPDRQHTGLKEFEKDIATFLGVEIIEYTPASHLDGIYDFFKCINDHGDSLIDKRIFFCPPNAFIISHAQLLREVMIDQNQNFFTLTNELHSLISLTLDNKLLAEIKLASGTFMESSGPIILQNLPNFSYMLSAINAPDKLKNFLKFLIGKLACARKEIKLNKMYDIDPSDLLGLQSATIVAISPVSAASGVKIVSAFADIQLELIKSKLTYVLNQKRVCFVAISEGANSNLVDDIFFKNYSEYCNKHQYSMFLFKDRILQNCTANWSKAELLSIILPNFEYVIFVDADTLLTKKALDLNVIDYFSQELQQHDVLFFADPSNWAFNSGSIILKRSELSHRYISDWARRCLEIIALEKDKDKDKETGVYAHGGDQRYAIYAARDMMPGFPAQVQPHNKGWNVHPIHANDNTLMIHFMGFGGNPIRSRIMHLYPGSNYEK